MDDASEKSGCNGAQVNCEAIEKSTAGGLIGDESPAGSTVAVVDDDESVRESLASLIESVGYQVASFGSAEEFLESLGDLAELGCLILDVRLPGMSGSELHAQLVGTGRCIPTVFITAHPDPLLATRSGIVDVLYKPFQPRDLLLAVRRAIT
jgi:FixJ family two-component response regulator